MNIIGTQEAETTTVLKRLFDSLKATRPGSRAANSLRSEIEHRLMQTLWVDGLRGVERAIARLNASGWAFNREPGTGRRQAGYRAWNCTFNGEQRLLEVSVLNSRSLQTTSVQYRRVVHRRLTPRQRKLFALHEAFYARYNAVARRAYTSSHGLHLHPADRLILLIAELEADVNNGGFGQYLDNKGRRRARTALAALRKVGAKRTEAMLRAALSSEASDGRLKRLDDRFYRSAEDLAALVMLHVQH